jgi:hypothetical protein
MKKTLMIVLLATIAAAALSADTYAQKGESWEIEYAIRWDDGAYEVLSAGTLSYTNTGNSRVNLDHWAQRQLGWSGATKRIRGEGNKYRTQRLILSCRKIS